MSKKTKVKKEKEIPPEEMCPICCEGFTKLHRKAVICPFEDCDFAACRKCVMRYLSEDTYDQAHCMNCKNPWSNAFVRDSCTKIFWKGPYQAHLDRLVLDREKNLIGETQVWMDHIRFPTRITEAMGKIDGKIHALHQSIMPEVRRLKAIRQNLAIAGQRVSNDLRQHAQPTLKIDPENLDVRTADGKMIYELAHLDKRQKGSEGKKKEPGVEGKDGGGCEPEEERETHSLEGTECPKGGCRGLLNHRNQCPICEVFVCAKCRQTKKSYVDEDHKCKPEDVKSVAFLKKSSKPCPSCGVPIHRISGCSHMWCTSCHTAFCWNSMKILNPARAHNPHMVQWLIQNGGANARGNAVPAADREVYNTLNTVIAKDRRKLAFLGQFWALHNHFHYMIGVLQRPFQNNHTLRDARLDFLRRHIDEEQWIRRLLKYVKAENRANAKIQLLETFMMGADTLVRCRLRDYKIPQIVAEATRLRDFFNAQWDLAFRAGEIGSVKRRISDKFHWYRAACPCEGKKECRSCFRGI